MLTAVSDRQPHPTEEIAGVLEREELTLLACGVGEDLPIELQLRVEAIRRRRAALVPPVVVP